MLALVLLVCLQTPAGQEPHGRGESTGIKPVMPTRVDAVVVAEGSLVSLKTKVTGVIVDIICSDEGIIHVMGDMSSGRSHVWFEAKHAGVCRLSVVNKEGKKDELLVVVERKVEKKKDKK